MNSYTLQPSLSHEIVRRRAHRRKKSKICSSLDAFGICVGLRKSIHQTGFFSESRFDSLEIAEPLKKDRLQEILC